MSLACLAAALLAGCIATGAHAQALRDPTQPPSFSEGASAGAPQGPILQSVIVSKGRTLAMIDGKAYREGDNVGGARIVAISGSEVLLRERGGSKVLKLYPDVQKKATRP